MAVYTPKTLAKRNPYGSLGPSPKTVAKVNAQRRKPIVKTVRAKVAVDPLTALYRRLQGQVKTDAQLRAEAQSLLGQQVGSSLDLIRSETQQLRADAERRRQMLTGAMMAAAEANQAMAPGILSGFTSAAATLGQLAQGATGAVGAAMRADIAGQQQALANVGAAPVNVGDPAAQQGVENMYGGYLPAANLAAMGALANQGHLREVGIQRMEAATRPWQEYEETIQGLDEKQLSALREIESKRPDMLADVLEGLRSNQEKVTSQMIDIQEERRQIAQQRARVQQAEASLRFKYQEAKAKAVTAQDKAALDRWYKAQQVKLSAARNAISATNAQTSIGRLAVAQQNAATSRIKATTTKSGFKPISEVVASMGRSRRDKPAGSDAKIIRALYQQYFRSVAPAERKELLRAINRWVRALPIRSSSKATNPFANIPTAG